MYDLGRELGTETFTEENGVLMHEMAETVLYTVRENRFHEYFFFSFPILSFEKERDGVLFSGFGGFFRFKLRRHVPSIAVSNHASRDRD